MSQPTSVRHDQIPRSPADVTAEWVTWALRHDDSLDGAAISSVAVEPIGAIDGFTGEVVRLSLTGSPSVPGSVIAKFANPDPQRRALFHRLGYAQRELRFYTELAARSNLRVPHLYFGVVDPESGASILLLEDLSGATRHVGQTAGCPAADAEKALRALARFHASWWDEAGDRIDWVPSFAAGADKIQHAFAQHWWPTFVREVETKIPGALSEPLYALGERLSTRVAALKRSLAEQPRTLIHQDFRLDNIFFDTATGPEAGVTVIDFENIARGRGASDVGWFLAGCLSTDERRAAEDALLHAYLDELRTHGIETYDLTACLRDLRLGMINTFVVAVSGPAVLGMLDTERGCEILRSVLERCAPLVDEHDLIEVLQ